MKQIIFILVLISIFNYPAFTQNNQQYLEHDIKIWEKLISEDKLQNYDDVLYSSYVNTDFNDCVYYSGKDDEGNYYLCGFTNGSITTVNSKIQNKSNGNVELFAYKLDENFQVIWSTMIGGNGNEYPTDAVITSNGDLWICGETNSNNFPSTRNPKNSPKGNYDGFLLCISNDGGLKFSEIFSSSSYDAFTQIAVANDGTCYAGGRTRGKDFQISYDAKVKNSASEGYNGVIIRIDANQNIYSSYIFGNSTKDNFLEGLAIDNNDNIIISGHTNDGNHTTYNAKLFNSYQGGEFDIYIQKYDKNFNLIWDNIFGGNNVDKISAINVDSDDNIYLLCFSNSNNLPVKNSLNLSYQNLYDAYLLKLKPDGELFWSTYIGSNNQDGFLDNTITMDRIHADLFMNGEFIGANFKTKGNNLPVNNNSFQKSNLSTGNNYEAYSIILKLDGSYYYSTYYGSNSNEHSNSIWFDNNELIICGLTSGELSTTSNALSRKKLNQNDGFILVLGIADTAEYNEDPAITSHTVDDCGNEAVYKINDQNNPYGFKNINIIQKENCEVSSLTIGRELTITVKKSSSTLKSYFKLEITNIAGKSIIIEDSLANSKVNSIRFEPEDFMDFGELSVFNGQYCNNIKLFNDSDDDFTIDDAYFKQYYNFSFSLSQLPIVIPAHTSKNFEVCVFNKKSKIDVISDTLVMISDCFYKELPFKVKYNLSNLYSNSKCDISLIGIPDSVNYYSQTSNIIYGNKFSIEMQNAKNSDISVYNLSLSKIEGIITNKSNDLIEFDFANLTSGTYFIYLNSNDKINMIKINLINY